MRGYQVRSIDPDIDRLRGLALFVGCSHDELALVVRNGTEHRARPGEVLIRQGDLSREFLVVLEGSATVYVADQAVARLGPGDFTGEVSLLDHGPRTATVVADTDLVARVSGPPEFAAILAGAPNLVRRLLMVLAARLRAADALLAP